MLNTVTIQGRLTKDPELRTTPNNVSVMTFTIATQQKYVRQGAERVSYFFDCVAWKQTAEFIARYFKKGQMMLIEGSLQQRKYTDKQGNDRSVIEILASNVYFSESKKTTDQIEDVYVDNLVDELIEDIVF